MNTAGVMEFTAEEFEAATGTPLEQWGCRCHEASLLLVKSGVLGRARVARGACKGVGGQHSWVVLGDDPYDRDATIIDPTLWSYDKNVRGVWVGSAREGRHTPHGTGSIWQWGRPNEAAPGQEYMIDTEGMSDAALRFLDMLGPLDLEGWRMLAHAPVEGWPSSEIFAAMYRDKNTNYMPIDIVGMATDLNPGGLYW